MDDCRELLSRGIDLCKRGQTADAQELLLKVIELDDRNEEAWLWLSGAVYNDDERRICLENVLTINPANTVAQKGLALLQARDERHGVKTQRRPEASKVAVADLAPEAAPWGDSAGVTTGTVAEPEPAWADNEESLWQTAPPWEEVAVKAGEPEPRDEVDAGAWQPSAAPWEETSRGEEEEFAPWDDQATGLAAEPLTSWQEDIEEEGEPAVMAWEEPEFASAEEPQGADPEPGPSQTVVPAEGTSIGTRTQPAAGARAPAKAEQKKSGDTVLLLAALGFLLLTIAVGAVLLLQ